MVVIARVRVYTWDGQTLRGTLPTSGLRFSVEMGGAGACEFTALADDLDTLTAWDSLLRVELETAPSTWTAVAAYALRPPFRRRRVGKPEVACKAVAVLEQWASETVMMPEYTVWDMPRGAGTERAIGWMSTAYDPTTDPNEAWDLCYEPSRSTFPTGWPTGTGAAWISATGATGETERKLFRATLTVTTAGPLRVYFTSDESATLYVGGEPVIETISTETGKNEYHTAELFAYPGDLAVAVDTASSWDIGGDGVDPIAVAVCTLDSDGDPDTWLLVSNDTDWVACRRDDEPPDNEPPGPTPGAILEALYYEADARRATGWWFVSLGFDATDDSYATAWPAPVVERFTRYGSDTYWAVFQMLAESGECDVWMDPDLTLHAAPTQGQDLTATVTLTEADITTMSDETGADEGSWAAGLARDGWVFGSTAGPRREYALEIGTALSRAVADRVVAGSLAETGRWDGSARLAPTAADVPLIDYTVGDRIALDYADAPTAVQVLSVSAEAGAGGLLWDLELAEVPA